MGCGASTAAPSTAYAIVPPDKKVEGAPAVERRKTLLGEQEEVALAKEVELTSPRGTAALAPGSGFRDASADTVSESIGSSSAASASASPRPVSLHCVSKRAMPKAAS